MKQHHFSQSPYADREITCLVIVVSVPEQVHRGLKGKVTDPDGNGIKGATISVKGMRKDITTGEHILPCLFIVPCHAAVSWCISGISQTVLSRISIDIAFLSFMCVTSCLTCRLHPVLFLLPLFLCLQLKMETTGGC